MISVFAAWALAATALTTNAARPAVAVVPPAPSDGQHGWIGMAIADDLTTRLLIHSRVDPSTMQRLYPLNVFGWRQTLAAARGDDIDASKPLDRAQAQRLARQLGADFVFVGNYVGRKDRVELRWALVGPKAHKEQFEKTTLHNLAEISEEVFHAVLRHAGEAAAKVQGHGLKPHAAAAVENYGKALLITRGQSLDPRARLVLSPTELKQARVLLTNATGVDPEFGRAWVERGLVSAMLGEMPQAEEELIQAMAHDGEFSPTTALGLYYLYDRQDKETDAIKVLKDSTETHLGFLQGLGYLGQSYLRTNHAHEALTVFTTYQSRAPRNPWVRVMRAATLSRIGKHDLAVQETEALLTELPDSVMVQAALASRYIDAKRFDDAQASLDKALQSHPDHPVLLTRLSYVELEKNNPQRALSLAQQAVSHLGRGRGETLAGYAHVNLAHALALLDKRDEAIAALKQAIALGVTAEDRLALLKDPRLQGFLNDPRCPIQPGAGHDHDHDHDHDHPHQ